MLGPDRSQPKINLSTNQSDTVGIERRTYGQHLDVLNTPGKKMKPTLTLHSKEEKSPFHFKVRKGSYKSTSK